MDAMKKTSLGAAILLSGWLSFAPAFAEAEDWAFTKWGMTVEEVVTASEGKAVPCDADTCRNMSGHADWATLSMPLQSDGFDLVAVFNFDRKTNLLTAVIIRPRHERDNTRWAVAERIKLKAAHGPWKEERWFGIPTWKWKWGDGEIRLTETTLYEQDIANVSYISNAWLEAMEADD
jgi:hypothetical protein